MGRNRFFTFVACLLVSMGAYAQLGGDLPPEFQEMMGGRGGTQNGDDLLDLEAMMKDVSNISDSSILKQPLIRFDPKLNENIDMRSFDYTGLWELVYKEYVTHDMKIAMYSESYEQKKCLFRSLVIEKDFLFGNTVCLSNFSLIVDPKKSTLSIEKVIDDPDISPRLRHIYSAFKERFDVKKVNIFEFSGEAYETENSYLFFVLNDETMVTFFDGYVFYLKKQQKVDPSLEVEQAAKMVPWDRDVSGNKVIVGKSTASVYDFLDSADMYSDDPRAQIHFVYYPPKLGQNYLRVENLYRNRKTGQMESRLLYANRETVNNIKHFRIKPVALLSNLLRFTVENSMSKKYSWGVKYKLQERSEKSASIKKKAALKKDQKDQHEKK